MSEPGPREPHFGDIIEAADRLRPVARRTPLLEAPLLNAAVGGRILVKAEPLQWTGSFKFRGAYNRISRLNDSERKKGVVAFSSGNHAQGVAYAARLLGVPAVIIMPKDAPAIKINNTRAYGAEVILYDRTGGDREAIGADIAEQRGCTMVRPFDDPFIIAGQGTVGLELAEQLTEAEAHPDAVLSPCSGGGLIAGTSLALEERLPGVPVYSVEPADFDDTARSLAAGKRVSNEPGGKSICDALLSPTPGEITFTVNRRTLAGGLKTTDQEVEIAMATAFRHFKMIIEPGGAAALAAALSGAIEVKGKILAVVASGGNTDADLYGDVLRRHTGLG